MPQWRVIYFFKDKTGAGWSETWHTTITAFPTFEAKVAALGSLRVAMLSADCKLVESRISDDLVFRDSVVSIHNQPGGINSGQDVPAVGPLCRISSGSLHRRLFFARGQPDDVIRNGVLDLGAFPGNAFQAAFNAWAAYLAGNSFALRVLTPIDGTERSVSNVTADGVMTLQGGPHGLVVGTVLYAKGFSNVRPTPNNRKFVIIDVPTATTLQVNGWFPRRVWGLGPADTGAKVFQKDTTFATVTAGVIERPGTRRTGRPFDVPVGRRRRVA